MVNNTSHPRSRRTVRQLVSVWLVAAALFFLWEVFVFRGLFARGASWQFAHIDEFWPTLTYGLLALLPALPAAVLGVVWYRRNKRREEALAPDDRLLNAQRRGARSYKRLRWVTAGLAAAALVSFVLALFQPGDSATPARVAVSLDGPEPAEGATVLDNAVRGRGVSFYSERLFFSRRMVRFAVVPTRDASGTLIARYFVQLAPDEPNWRDPARPIPTTRSGILVRDGLPGPVEQMYRQRGYTLAQPHYVLYESERMVRRPFVLTGIEIGLMALVTALVAWRQRRHNRRLETWNDEEERRLERI